MDQCFNCKEHSNHTVEICCPNGGLVCRGCALNGDIDQHSKCIYCQRPYGKRYLTCVSEFLNATKKLELKNKTIQNQQNNQENLIQTKKKLKPVRNQLNFQHAPQTYFQNAPPLMTNYGANPNFHPYPVQYGYQTHPSYFVPFPQYSQPQNHPYQNWNQDSQYFNPQYQNQNLMRYNGHPPNWNQNQMQYNQKMYQQATLQKLMHSAQRGISPFMDHINQQEEQNNFHFRHNDGDTHHFNMNKTTDYLDDRSPRNKCTRMNRSTSVNNLTTKR